MLKNKKLIIGIFVELFFLLILAKTVNAYCQPKEPPPPGCPGPGEPVVICSGLAEDACNANNCCEWVPEKEKPGEERTECGLATCAWLDIGCYLIYFLTLPLRVIALLIGAIGLGVGLIVIWIGFGVIPGIINAIINTSLSLNYGEILRDWPIVSQLKDISLELIYLFLLIIGLGTILKFLFPFAEYEAKKTLVPLIAFALLINFAPTISQKIIKWGNDATKALKTTLVPESGEDFLHSTTIGQKLSEVLVNSTSLLGDIFCIDGHWERYFKEHEGKGPVIPMIMLYAAYPWIVASVGIFILSSFISFGILFMMRTILFIVLVTVSPIAFLSAALRTKEMRAIFPGFLNWEDWSKTLLQWAFIGVMLVIWLAVAEKIAEMGGDLFLGETVEIGGVNVSKPTTLKDLESQLTPEMKKLVKYLIPPLGAAMAIFFASLTTPKLGEEFSKAAFGFLNKVGSALLTGAIIGTAAVFTAGATAFVGGLPKAIGSFRKGISAFRRGDVKGGLKGIGAGFGHLGAPIWAMGRQALQLGVKTIPTYVTKAVVPKEMREEIAKYPFLRELKAAPWSREVIDFLSARKRETLERFAERHPDIFRFIFATPARDVRQAADVRRLAEAYGIPEDEVRRVLTGLLRREVRKRITQLPPYWQPPPPPTPPPPPPPPPPP